MLGRKASGTALAMGILLALHALTQAPLSVPASPRQGSPSDPPLPLSARGAAPAKATFLSPTNGTLVRHGSVAEVLASIRSAGGDLTNLTVTFRVEEGAALIAEEQTVIPSVPDNATLLWNTTWLVPDSPPGTPPSSFLLVLLVENATGAEVATDVVSVRHPHRVAGGLVNVRLNPVVGVPGDRWLNVTVRDSGETGVPLSATLEMEVFGPDGGSVRTESIPVRGRQGASPAPSTAETATSFTTAISSPPATSASSPAESPPPEPDANPPGAVTGDSCFCPLSRAGAPRTADLTYSLTIPIDRPGTNRVSLVLNASGDETPGDDLWQGIAVAAAPLLPDTTEFGAPGWGLSGEWELGTPSYPLGPLGAGAGSACFGTDLDDRYDNDRESVLASPVVDLTGLDPPFTFRWMEWLGQTEIPEGLVPGGLPAVGSEDVAKVELFDGAWSEVESRPMGGWSGPNGTWVQREVVVDRPMKCGALRFTLSTVTSIAETLALRHLEAQLGVSLPENILCSAGWYIDRVEAFGIPRNGTSVSVRFESPSDRSVVPPGSSVEVLVSLTHQGWSATQGTLGLSSLDGSGWEVTVELGLEPGSTVVRSFLWPSPEAEGPAVIDATWVAADGSFHASDRLVVIVSRARSVGVAYEGPPVLEVGETRLPFVLVNLGNVRETSLSLSIALGRGRAVVGLPDLDPGESIRIDHSVSSWEMGLVEWSAVVRDGRNESIGESGGTIAVLHESWEESFDSGDGNWTHCGSDDDWEWGVPSPTLLGPNPDRRCWGTNLTGDYSSTSESFLRSPPLDVGNLTTVGPFWLAFDLWLSPSEFMGADIAAGDLFEVAIVSGNASETIASVGLNDPEWATGEWTTHYLPLPNETDGPFSIEFRFLSVPTQVERWFGLPGAYIGRVSLWGTGPDQARITARPIDPRPGDAVWGKVGATVSLVADCNRPVDVEVPVALGNASSTVHTTLYPYLPNRCTVELEVGVADLGATLLSFGDLASVSVHAVPPVVRDDGASPIWRASGSWTNGTEGPMGLPSRRIEGEGSLYRSTPVLGASLAGVTLWLLTDGAVVSLRDEGTGSAIEWYVGSEPPDWFWEAGAGGTGSGPESPGSTAPGTGTTAIPPRVERFWMNASRDDGWVLLDVDLPPGWTACESFVTCADPDGTTELSRFTVRGFYGPGPWGIRPLQPSPRIGWDGGVVSFGLSHPLPAGFAAEVAAFGPWIASWDLLPCAGDTVLRVRLTPERVPERLPAQVSVLVSDAWGRSASVTALVGTSPTETGSVALFSGGGVLFYECLAGESPAFEAEAGLDPPQGYEFVHPPVRFSPPASGSFARVDWSLPWTGLRCEEQGAQVGWAVYENGSWSPVAPGLTADLGYVRASVVGAIMAPHWEMPDPVRDVRVEGAAFRPSRGGDATLFAVDATVVTTRFIVPDAVYAHLVPTNAPVGTVEVSSLPPGSIPVLMTPSGPPERTGSGYRLRYHWYGSLPQGRYGLLVEAVFPSAHLLSPMIDGFVVGPYDLSGRSEEAGPCLAVGALFFVVVPLSIVSSVAAVWSAVFRRIEAPPSPERRCQRLLRGRSRRKRTRGSKREVA